MSGPQAACFFNTNVECILPASQRVVDSLPPAIRKRLADLARAGRGGELLLDRPLDLPERGICRLGGNAGNAANAFGELGVPALCHTNNGVSRERRMVNRLVTLIGPDSPPSVHYVVDWGIGGYLRARKPNRVILTYDPANRKGMIYPRFASSLLRMGAGVRAAFFSGLHISSDPRKPADLARRLVRSGVFVHCEFNLAQSVARSKGILRAAHRSFQSFGCNSDEAAALAGSPAGLLKLTGASRAIVHGPEEIQIVFSEKAGYSVDRTRFAADFAASTAAAKVATGHNPCREELAALAENGLIRRRPTECSARCRKGVFEMKIPAWSSSRTRTSLGLGDCFAAAFLAAERGLL